MTKSRLFTNSSKRTWILLGCLGVVLIIAVIIIVMIIRNNSAQQNQQTDTWYSNKVETVQEGPRVVVDSTCLENASALGPSDSEISAAQNNSALLAATFTKTIQMYDAKLKCYAETDGSLYADTISDLQTKKAELEQMLASYKAQNTYSSEYTHQESATPKDYNISEPEQTAPSTSIPTCTDYHQRYYASYSSKLASINASYNSKISSASMNCSGQGGCPAVTNLKQQLASEIASLKNEYKTNMINSGCNPTDYVDF